MSKARAVRPELLTLLVSLAFLLFYNLPLWQRLLAITPAGWQGLGMMLAVGLMIAAIFNLALTLLAFRWLLKPALTLLMFRVVLGESISAATGQPSVFGTGPMTALCGGVAGAMGRDRLTTQSASGAEQTCVTSS